MARVGFVFMAFFLEPQISDLFTATENPILIEINHPVLAVWLKQFFTAGCLLISQLLINKLFIYLFSSKTGSPACQVDCSRGFAIWNIYNTK